MNTSPVESFEGAAAIFTFAANEGAVKGIFWGMCAVLVLVVVSSIIHEIRVGAKVARRRDYR
jgi:hypothetical protein